MGAGKQFGVIMDDAVGPWVLDQKTGDPFFSNFRIQPCQISDYDFETKRLRSRADDFDILRVTLVGNQKYRTIAWNPWAWRQLMNIASAQAVASSSKGIGHQQARQIETNV